MNIGFGYSPSLAAEVEASISELIGSRGLSRSGPEGFYSEFQEPMRHTFEALGCSDTFALTQAGSPDAPDPAATRDVICAIAQTLTNSAVSHAAFIFAAEWDDDPRYRSGSPADLERILRAGWSDDRMRFGGHGGLRPFHIQEISAVPLVFDLTPPSA